MAICPAAFVQHTHSHQQYLAGRPWGWLDGLSQFPTSITTGMCWKGLADGVPMVTLAEKFTKQLITSWVIFLWKHVCSEVLTDSLKFLKAWAKMSTAACTLLFRHRQCCLPGATTIIQFFSWPRCMGTMSDRVITWQQTPVTAGLGRNWTKWAEDKLGNHFHDLVLRPSSSLLL